MGFHNLTHTCRLKKPNIYHVWDGSTFKTQEFKAKVSKTFIFHKMKTSRISHNCISFQHFVWLFTCHSQTQVYELLEREKKRQTVGFLDFEIWEENTFNNPNSFMRGDITFLRFMHWWYVWDGRSFRHHIVLFFRWLVRGQKVARFVWGHKGNLVENPCFLMSSPGLVHHIIGPFHWCWKKKKTSFFYVLK